MEYFKPKKLIQEGMNLYKQKVCGKFPMLEEKRAIIKDFKFKGIEDCLSENPVDFSKFGLYISILDKDKIEYELHLQHPDDMLILRDGVNANNFNDLKNKNLLVCCGTYSNELIGISFDFSKDPVHFTPNRKY